MSTQFQLESYYNDYDNKKDTIFVSDDGFQTEQQISEWCKQHKGYKDRKGHNNYELTLTVWDDGKIFTQYLLCAFDGSFEQNYGKQISELETLLKKLWSEA